MAYDPNEYHHFYRDYYQSDNPDEPGGFNVHDDPYQPGEVYLYPPPHLPAPSPEGEPFTSWVERTTPPLDANAPQRTFMAWLQVTWPMLMLQRLLFHEVDVDETRPKPVGLLARLRSRR